MSQLLMMLLLAAPPAPACPAMSEANIAVMYFGAASSCTPFAMQTCFAGETVAFNPVAFGYNFGCSTHLFLWNFGDGTTSSERQPMHTYVALGVYTVTLTIANGMQTASFTAPVRVAGTYHPIPFLVLPIRGVARAYRFTIIDALGSGDWIWDFGDGTSARGPERKRDHVYAAPGRYTVRLSSTGHPATYEDLVSIEPPSNARRRSARH